MKGNDTGTDFRSQLLQQIRQERQQCFAVAEAAARQRGFDRAALNYSALDNTAALTQQEIVNLDESRGDQRREDLGAVPQEALVESDDPDSVPGHGATGRWNAEDDVAQAEALRDLRLLGEQSRRVSTLEAISEESSPYKASVEEELSCLQGQIALLEQAVTKEREQRQSMQEQMLCLEQELDGKEAAISDFERALERKEEQLALARRGYKREVADEDARVKLLELQLRDREKQLEAKDGHIMRLLGVLRQHRSTLLDEDSCSPPRLSLADTVKVF